MLGFGDRVATAMRVWPASASGIAPKDFATVRQSSVLLNKGIAQSRRNQNGQTKRNKPRQTCRFLPSHGNYSVWLQWEVQTFSQKRKARETAEYRRKTAGNCRYSQKPDRKGCLSIPSSKLNCRNRLCEARSHNRLPALYVKPFVGGVHKTLQKMC